MEHTGLLSKIDSRTFTIDNEPYYARKAQLDLLKDTALGLVTVTFEEDAGYKMIKDIKPEIPSTQVEKTPAQPQQAPSQNMTTADSAVKGIEFVQKAQPRSQKDLDITYSWSFNCATSDVWANCNDALVLSTEQMKTRIRDLAAWYRNELLSR